MIIYVYKKSIFVFISPQISIAFAQGPLVHEFTQINHKFVNICVICGSFIFSCKKTSKYI